MNINRSELLAELRTFIEDFMDDTGLGRHEFVIVCNPECPVIQSPSGRHHMLDGVNVFMHEKMYINGVTLLPHDELEDIDELITEMDLDKPDGGGLGYGVPVDRSGAFECFNCGHPIALAVATKENVVHCPWCHTKNAI